MGARRDESRAARKVELYSNLIHIYIDNAYEICRILRGGSFFYPAADVRAATPS
jgi:hypothetical protein